ncbi:MAG: M23 family metallopeptidase [Clostridia bacterium]|nr:M23 family metallopeptidase [Clostridia bacterium]
MKYRRQKTHLKKYTSCKTSEEKEKLLKLAGFKRRFTIILFFSMIVFFGLRQNPVGINIRNFLTSATSNESDVFISAKNYMTKKLSFLNKIGESGAKFTNNYLKPSEKEIVHAESKALSAGTEEKIKPSSQSDPLITSAVQPEKKDDFLPIRPHDGIITSSFGERVHPVSGNISMHNGIDIAAVEGDEVRATESGIIEKAEYNQYSGNFIVIRHSDTITSSYAHMSKLNVKEGDEVEKGDIIGYAGSTGTATGPHVHMEIRIDKIAVNPEEYFAKR